MGRRSLAVERREQILRAAAACIARHGVDGATQERIAELAGLSRQHVRHYVGNREHLLEAVWEWVIEPYNTRLREFGEVEDPQGRLTAVLDFLFGPEFGFAEDDAVISAVLIAAANDRQLGDRVLASYVALDEALAETLHEVLPEVDRPAAEDCAHALSCLAIGGSMLSALPAAEVRQRGLRAQADALVRQLRRPVGP